MVIDYGHPKDIASLLYENQVHTSIGSCIRLFHIVDDASIAWKVTYLLVVLATRASNTIPIA